MLKKILFLLLVFVVNPFWSQDKIVDTSVYKISYKLIYQQDSINPNGKKEEKMTLLISKNYSIFQSENNRFNDSLMKYFSSYNIQDAQLAVSSFLSAKKNTRFKYKIIKSRNNILVFDRFTRDKFVYEERGKLKWKITNETKQINNYLCQKATTVFAGRNYVAWFTHEIPINDGPYKFKGLPGLIIKIYDKRRHYNFELFSLKKHSIEFAIIFDKTQKVSKKDYYKAYNNFKSNIVAQLEQRGIILDEAGATRARQRVKKTMNNEIELKFD